MNIKIELIADERTIIIENSADLLGFQKIRRNIKGFRIINNTPNDILFLDQYDIDDITLRSINVYINDKLVKTEKMGTAPNILYVNYTTADTCVEYIDISQDKEVI